MENPILFEDLVAYKTIEAGLAKLTAAVEQFGSVATQQNERVTKSLLPLKAELLRYKEILDSLSNNKAGNARLDGLKDDFKSLSDSVRNNQSILKQNKTVLEENTNLLAGMQKRVKELKNEYSSLDSTEAKAQNRRKQIITEMKQLSVVINAEKKIINEATKATAEAERTYYALENETKKLRTELKSLAGEFDPVTGKLDKTNKAAVTLQTMIERNTKALRQMDAQLGNWSKNIDKSADSTGGFGGVIAAVGKSFLTFEAIKQAAEWVIDFGKEVLNTTATFEKYAAIMSTTLGSTTAGAAAFELIQQVAAKTNFSVEELTEGYILLANRGLRPTEAQIMKMADVANATGKPMSQLIEAIADINNSERWNEFGIKAKTAGDKVSLTFKGVTVEVDRTEQGVMKAIETFGGLPGVLGMTDKIAQTLDGQLSNLGDNFDRLKYTIGKDLKGGFESLIALGNYLIDLFIKIWIGAAPVREGFGLIADAIGRAGRSIGNLVTSYVGLDEKTVTSEAIIKGAVNVFRFMASNVLVAVTAVNLLVDTYNLLINKAKEAANFFGASFKIDENASNRLTENFRNNINSIGQVWTDKPATASTKPNASAIPGEQKMKPPADKTKEAAEADKRLREAISKTKAMADEQLAQLNQDRQDGLLSEQDYIEKRYKITLDGIRKQEDLLAKAGKKETDDYINLQKEKLKAKTEYSRAELQLNLKTNKETTAETLAALDVERNEGSISELEYVEKRHKAVVDGIDRERMILRAAGQEKTELYKATNSALEKEQSEYLRGRLSAEKKAWQDELKAAEEGLRAIDQKTALAYENELHKARKYYSDLRHEVELAQANGSISDNEAAQRLHLIDVDEIRAEMDIYGQFIKKSKELGDELLKAKIAQLQAFKESSQATAKEILEADKQIAKIESLLSEREAERKQKTAEKTSEKEMDEAEKVHELKMKLAQKERQFQEEALALVSQNVAGGFQFDGLEAAARAIMDVRNKIAENNKKRNQEEIQDEKLKKQIKLQTIQELAEDARVIGLAVVNTLYSIEQQRTSRELEELDKRKEYELSMAGDSANARIAIERKYEAERKQLQRQQDEATRNKAIFEIAINTAVAIVKALPNVALAAIVGGVGALQLGLAMSQPLPAYFTGKGIDGLTNDNYAGPATISEFGRELWQQDGKWSLVDKPSIVNVKRDDIILPNWLTEKVLNNNIEGRQIAQHAESTRLFGQRVIDQQITAHYGGRAGSRYNGPSAREIGLEVAKAMADNPTWSLNLDKNGFDLYQETKAGQRRELRNYWQLGKKGRKD